MYLNELFTLSLCNTTLATGTNTHVTWQVSCTVTFDPKTEGPQLRHALDLYQYQLKGVSFLPTVDQGAYAQMPYEEMTEEQYFIESRKLKKLVTSATSLSTPSSSEAEVSITSSFTQEMPDKFCDAAGCSVDGPALS